MPRKSYSPQDRNAIRDALIEEANKLFAHNGIARTNLSEIYEKVGISRAFFYRFFDAKISLAKAVLLTLFPRMQNAFLTFLHDPNEQPWEERMAQFLWFISDPTRSGCALPSPEEQNAILQTMTPEEKHAFDQQRRDFACTILAACHIPRETMHEGVFFNRYIILLTMRHPEKTTFPLCFDEQTEDAFASAVTAFIQSLTRMGAHF